MPPFYLAWISGSLLVCCGRVVLLLAWEACLSECECAFTARAQEWDCTAACSGGPVQGETLL